MSEANERACINCVHCGIEQANDGTVLRSQSNSFSHYCYRVVPKWFGLINAPWGGLVPTGATCDHFKGDGR